MKSTHRFVLILRLQAVRLLLFLLVWAGCLETSAQSGSQPFERTIDYQNHVEAASTMTILDDTIYFFSKGWAQQDPAMLRKVVLNKCDLNGNLISQKILFESDPYSYATTAYTDILTDQDSNLLLVASRTDGISPNYPQDAFLAKLTRSGDTIWTRQYHTPDTSEVPRRCKWTPWGDIFCVGYSARSPGDLDGYAALFSNNGKNLWTRKLHYTINDGIGTISRIEQNPKQFIVTGGTTIGNADFKGVKWSLDSVGALLGMHFLTGREASGLWSYPDILGGYISFQRILVNEPDYYPMMVRSYDSSWTEQWSVLLDDLHDISFLTHIEVMPDTSYWICGWAYTDQSPSSNYAQLIKVDKYGKVAWYKRYYLSDPEVNARLSYIRHYSLNNSVYGIGTTLRSKTSNNSDAWLVRFDSVGCLEPGCDTIVGQEFPLPLQPENLSVYPNPASGPMAVDIPPKLREPARELIIGNLAGQQVQSHTLTGAPRKMVDMGDLPSGLYLAEVWGSDGLLGRVKFVRQ